VISFLLRILHVVKMYPLEVLQDIAQHVHKRRQCVLAKRLLHLEVDLVQLGSLIFSRTPQSPPRSQMHHAFAETLNRQLQNANHLTLKRRKNDRNADDESESADTGRAVLQNQESQTASWISSIS
jgi:hypothetical protein